MKEIISIGYGRYRKIFKRIDVSMTYDEGIFN